MTITLLSLACALASSAVAGTNSLATTLAAPPSTTQFGSWTPLTHLAPEAIGYAMLLSDGTVMAQGYANSTWYRLTPDSKGRYWNGTWTTLAPMHDTRLYFFAQTVKDGRVVCGGGEYGTGGPKSEYYDPVANTWTPIAGPGVNWVDGNSEILPNGNVITAPVFGEPGTLVFDLGTNTWSAGPSNLGGQDESAWVKLPDSSILTIDPFGTNTERYIPSLNKWVRDAVCPVDLYGYGGELGGGYLLPNGKVIYFGATSHSAIYTPSGTSQPGTWTLGPDLPNSLGQVDAPAAMMPNGKILLALGTTAGFGSVSYWYEYDYQSNSFTQVMSPTGGFNFNAPEFIETLLDLPDGTILQTGISQQLYVYTPAGSQLAAGKPAIKAITQNHDGSFHLTGTLFNGISEGAGYGDDWQMATNFPIARLTDLRGNVSYLRTFGWSSTGVQTGSQLVSTEMSVPANFQRGLYQLQVVANGIASDPVPFFNGYSAYAVSLDLGVNGHGSVSDILKIDGNCYSGTSQMFAGSQTVEVEADFALPP
ncbi:MAG TPA: hypothetical protein VKT78_19000, partial [Fimbriimonadaceae bacterium]|nr:hypothetical protein [Fimbriimonadaceae bacterium]